MALARRLDLVYIGPSDPAIVVRIMRMRTGKLTSAPMNDDSSDLRGCAANFLLRSTSTLPHRSELCVH